MHEAETQLGGEYVVAAGLPGARRGPAGDGGGGVVVEVVIVIVRVLYYKYNYLIIIIVAVVIIVNDIDFTVYVVPVVADISIIMTSEKYVIATITIW